MATAELDIRIRSGDVPNATKELQRLERQGATTERGIAGLTSGFGKLASAAAGLASISAAMNKLVSTARQFDQLNAGLLTMTGSSENAAIAFAELEKFAAKTPYTLDQSVQGFTKLVALGLNPSQRAMESYGNTAAAMGKDLSQMIEAVADAATGEFERLKEFGIKSKQQGDKVSFTFQGVTTTVGKNAAEIEGYLQSLGENQFAGAMANRMNTLDGALSNLQDSWDGLFRSISSQGAGQEIEQGVRVAIGALDELTAMISSGELTANIKAWGGQWQATMQDVATTLDDLDSLFTGVMNDWGVKGEDAAGVLGRAFSEFPANIRASIQIATTYLAGFIDKVGVYAGAASALLDPRNMFTSIHKTLEPYKQELEQIDNTVMGLNVGYLNQRDTAIQSFSQQTEAAKKMRAEFDLIKNGTSADLGQFKAGGSTEGGDAVAARASKAADQQAKADARKREMQLQGARAWLERANQFGATELEQIDYWQQQELAKLREFEQKKLLIPSEAHSARVAIVEEAARREIELQDKVLQKSLESSRLKAQAEQQATAQMASMQWGLASQSLDAISMAAEEGSTLQKAAFVAGKGMAAAQAIMQAELASVSTLAAYAAAAAAAGPGGPALLAAGTAQAAAMKTMGYASAAIIAAQGFAGMFDNGGNIGSGQWGIVGENGPEIVKGPVNVTSRKKTAAMAANLIRAQGAISTGIVAGQAIGGFAGMFDKGGDIPAGSFGIGAEKRNEFINSVLVKGPARITGGAQTEKKIEAAARGHDTMLGGLLTGETAVTLIRAQGAISAGIVDGKSFGKFAGAFDNGGNIKAGQFGIVGERGAEIVTGPATVTSRKDTKALIDGAGGSGGMTVYITQNIQGNSDAVLAELVDRATRNALNETQADFAKNGRLRKTLGV